jgi:hypothetical protein
MASITELSSMYLMLLKGMADALKASTYTCMKKIQKFSNYLHEPYNHFSARMNKILLGPSHQTFAFSLLVPFPLLVPQGRIHVLLAGASTLVLCFLLVRSKKNSRVLARTRFDLAWLNSDCKASAWKLLSVVDALLYLLS